jgi:phenolic acid decarboxylase
MESNEINDILFFEKLIEEKAEIKTICNQCEHFAVVSVTHEIPVIENKILIMLNVEYLNPTCKNSNQILVFDQIKSFQKCPINRW